MHSRGARFGPNSEVSVGASHRVWDNVFRTVVALALGVAWLRPAEALEAPAAAASAAQAASAAPAPSPTPAASPTSARREPEAQKKRSTPPRLAKLEPLEVERGTRVTVSAEGL